MKRNIQIVNIELDNKNLLKPMKNLTPLPRIESKAPDKNSIEWELPNKAKFVYMIVQGLGHTTAVCIKKDTGEANTEWLTEMIHENDAMTAIAKGVDFLEQYGYTLDNSDFSYWEKKRLGLDTLNDFN